MSSRNNWKQEQEWNKIVEGLSKPAKKAKVKELEKEINILSMVFMGSDNPKKDHPKVYVDLQQVKTKLKQLKLELRMTPTQLKKLKTHYGMGVGGAELTRVYKGLPKASNQPILRELEEKFELLEDLLSQSAGVLISIKVKGRDIFKTKQTQRLLHKIEYHIYIAEKEIGRFFFPFLDKRLEF